jgi:hypothetical protein
MRATTTETLDEPLPGLEDEPVPVTMPDCQAHSEALSRWIERLVRLTMLGDD